MPIARSNTGRNHSRSPIPSSDGYHAPTRPFLPPSHYAAAAGILYPSSLQSSSQSEHSEFSEATPSIMSKDSSMDPQDYHSAFVPVSYLPESGATSDSSFEFRVSLGSRYSASGGDKHPSSSKTPVRSKRQSHITGLPQLETHLLPSLRDTIDRMTRTPSNAGSSSSSSNSTHLDVPKPSEGMLSMSSPSPSSPQPSHPVHTDSFSTKSRLPEPSSSFRAQSRSTTPMELSRSRSKTPVKSALKSALRAPTPKLFSNPSSGTEAMGSSPSGGVSLKSVRSMLSRKMSSASLSETPIPSGNSGRKSTAKKQTMVPSFQHLRGRSQTDPGTVKNPDLRSPSDRMAIPSETNYSATMLNKTKQKPSTSGIPRLQSRLDTHYRTDDSDVEFQYETQARERRKLIVANAEVFASSSESEAEMKERETAEAEHSKEGWRSDMNSHGAKNMVGLGLDLRSSASRKRYSGGCEPTNRHAGQTWPAEDNTRLRDVNNWAPGAPSQTSGRNTRKDYESSSNSYLTALDVDHHRRRAALLGIVSSLDLQTPSTVAGESEESEDCGEDGFAISGSGELDGESSQSTKAGFRTTNINDDSENCPEIRPRRTSYEVRRTSRPRSSSCMPTFVVSNDDEGNQFIPGSGSSHRPRSIHQYSWPSPSATPNPGKGHKSSSRSPVVRQDDLASIPVALRRHSVYHRSPSPNTGIQSPNDKRLSKKIDHDRRDIDAPDALMITERSYAAAARERRALGIPPSESVEVYQGVTHDRAQALTHAESDLSSVGSQYWNEDTEDLSPGAETLFRKLSGGPTKEMERRGYQQNVDNSTRSSVISRRSSVSSIYEDQDSEDRWQDHEQDHTAVSHSEIVDPNTLSMNGPPEHDFDDVEMRRQDLIREICQTEEAFVNRLHTFVKLFVLPLRVQDSKTWILGVPSEVARLFDWLDDIMNLHSELLSSLQLTRTAQYPIVEHIAGSMRTFIPRLEIYQPYLVRLVDVTSLIQQLVEDEKSDFGEFVDIQEGAAECGGWKFDRFLAEPVNRLAQYPDFFSRLVGLTPKTHPDYLSTFFLLHSTEMVIRVMTEVKVREDEYDLIKNFLSRIRGLPSDPQIAIRERRLLFHGVLHLLTVDDEEVTISNNVLLPVNTPQDYVPAVNPPNRTSRLANAINKWDARRRRSESTSSSSTSTLFGTISSGASSDMPATPCSTFFSSFRIPVPNGRLNAARIPEQKRVLVSPSPNPRHPSAPGIPVQVFIFTDLVLLATPDSSLTPENSNWTLLEDIGIIRILDTFEPSEQDSSESDLFVLDTIPIDTSKFNQCMREEDGPVVTLRFLIPTQHTPMLSGKFLRSEDKTRNSWISAFQQCFRFTLRSTSVPPHSKSFSYNLQSDHDHDTQQTIFSLLASGLPLPKSPSAQLVDLQHDQPGDIKRQEREERGWWSLRFQQIFRELQRQDMSVPV